MSAVEQLSRLGGLCTRATLLAAASRAEVDTALAAGDVVRLARGRYGLKSVDEARAAAHAMTGVVCLTSAALLWGWPVKLPPDRPQISVPKKRKVAQSQARGVELRRLDLAPDDVADGVTTRDRTLLDCLRHLPFDEALAIADSALRDGFSPARLTALADDARGPRAIRIRQVAAVANPLAANPFESVLRAIALGVPGLQVRPQVSLRGATPTGTAFLGRPDLVDDRLCLAIEADSFEWHGGRAALRTDAQRYNAFAVHGWLVLRFAWEDVMFHPDYVRDVLNAAVAERTNLLCANCRRAS